MFTYRPTLSNLLSTHSLLIRFPRQFPRRLASWLSPIRVECAQLTGALKAEVTQHDLVISGLYSQAVSTDLVISIYNIINPNLDSSSAMTLSIGVLLGSTLIEQQSTSVDVPSLSPNVMTLSDLITDQANARNINKISVTIQPKETVQPEDQLVVQIPRDYSIDQFSGVCSISQAFSFYSSCRLNLLNNRLTYTTSHTAYSPQAIQTAFSPISTNNLSGHTSNFVFFFYRLSDFSITQRTYSTISPSSLSYGYGAALLTVNQDTPYTLTVGTYSDEIIIQLATKTPSLQTLTLTPAVLDSAVVVTPNPVRLEVG